VNVAAQAFLRTVSKVVGGDVIDDAIAFFQTFQGMEAGFRDRADAVLVLLSAECTAFVLVASPHRDTVREASFFAARLGEAGIAVRALVVNRMHPQFGEVREPDDLPPDSALADHYRNLAEFRLVAEREAEHLGELRALVGAAPTACVPFLRTDVHDLAGLDEVGRYLFTRSA
jgi:anion-transporting  ArsA/GET3 family ATPase